MALGSAFLNVTKSIIHCGGRLLNWKLWRKWKDNYRIGARNFQNIMYIEYTETVYIGAFGKWCQEVQELECVQGVGENTVLLRIQYPSYRKKAYT